MKLSVLIPVYNEARWLPLLWKRIQGMPVDTLPKISHVEVIWVDDGSSDGTKSFFDELSQKTPPRLGKVRLSMIFLRNEENRGKGYSVRRAIEASTGDVVVIQDGDLEYSPQDLPKLLGPILDGVADCVVGTRFQGYPRRVMYFFHTLVNKMLTLIFNFLHDVNLTDMEVAYKAINGDIARSLRLTSDRFGLEPELCSRIVHAQCKVFEVPVSYEGRSYEEGKKIGPLDGIAALFHILKFGILDREPFKPGVYQTLSALDKASKRIYAPLIKKAFRFLGQRVDSILELGAGVGTVSSELVKHTKSLTCSDLDPTLVAAIDKRFSHQSDIRAVVADATNPKPLKGKTFDVVVASNLLEHLPDDKAALMRWRELIKEDGSLLLVVPYGPRLFSKLDQALGHHRRYSKASLHAVLGEAGFTPVTTFFGNPIALVWWAIGARMLGIDTIPRGQLRLYWLLKPIIVPLEAVLSKFVGVNLVVLCRRETLASDRKTTATASPRKKMRAAA
jgi:glycosyltransferase involved in cell wall biosynthesis